MPSSIQHWPTVVGIVAGAICGMALLKWMPYDNDDTAPDPEVQRHPFKVDALPASGERSGGAKEWKRNWLKGFTQGNRDEISELSGEEILQRLNNPPIPDQLQYWLVLKLSEEDPAAALSWCMDARYFRDLDVVFEQAARFDKGFALAALDQLERGQNRTSAIRGIALGMAAEDPGAALQFLEAAEKPHFFKSFFTTEEIVAQWTRNDPQAAGGFILEAKRGPERDKMMDQLAVTWAKKDFEEAMAWAQSSIPIPLDRRKFSNAIIEQFKE